MDANTSSTVEPTSEPARAAGLARLVNAIDQLAAEDPAALPDPLAAEEVLALRRQLDRLEAVWQRALAALDGRGAAGAETGAAAPSTAGWLRARLRLDRGAAGGHVRVARALHRGRLPATAAAALAGELSPQHTRVLADGLAGLPAGVAGAAEPVLLDAARHLDPHALRRVAEHLRAAADPQGDGERARARWERRGLQVAPTWQGLTAVDGLLDPEQGETLLAALQPLARPTGPGDPRSAPQRRADALAELCRQALEAGRLPGAGGGVRPQVTVTVDLASLLGASSVPGAFGWGGVADPETTRRLACDAALTRMLITSGHPTAGRLAGNPDGLTGRQSGDPTGLTGRLRAALAGLPPALGGTPQEVIDLGRTTRVIPTRLRRALAARDHGCTAPGCDRPAAYTDAHHLRHWLDGGPTSLDNLVLLCRTHHRATHHGHLTLTHPPPPPDHPPPTHPPARGNSLSRISTQG